MLNAEKISNLFYTTGKIFGFMRRMLSLIVDQEQFSSSQPLGQNKAFHSFQDCPESQVKFSNPAAILIGLPF